MRSILVIPSDQKSNTVWSLSIVIGFLLRFFSYFEDESVQRLIGSIGELVVHGFVSHVLAENSGISGQSTHSHADVVVDFEHFLLIACEFRGKSLERA